MYIHILELGLVENTFLAKTPIRYVLCLLSLLGRHFIWTKTE